MTVFFGIDVAKEKLDRAVVTQERQRPIGQKSFPNNPDGIERAAAWVMKVTEAEFLEVRAVLEPTAAYHGFRRKSGQGRERGRYFVPGSCREQVKLLSE